MIKKGNGCRVLLLLLAAACYSAYGQQISTLHIRQINTIVCVTTYFLSDCESWAFFTKNNKHVILICPLQCYYTEWWHTTSSGVPRLCCPLLLFCKCPHSKPAAVGACVQVRSCQWTYTGQCCPPHCPPPLYLVGCCHCVLWVLEKRRAA